MRGSHRVQVTAELYRSIGPAATLRRLRQEVLFRGLGTFDSYPSIWRDAAQALGARITDLGGGLLEISKDGRRTRVDGLYTSIDGDVTLRFVGEKAAANAALAAAGIRLPEQVDLAGDDLDGALRFMTQTPPPWVLKPTGGSGGQGITTGLRTLQDFESARRRALLDGSRLLLERQVPGDLHRVLVLDGEVLDVLRRHPSRVIGDGRSSVSELIDAENRARLSLVGHGTSLVFIDFECVVTLRAQGLSLTDVPARGRVVALKSVTNQNGAGDNHTVREPLAPEITEQAARAADALGLRLAGVDLITTDAGRPLAETGGAVIEVNAHPGLHYHYAVADPANATPVAIPVLRALLA